ncbi:hypothetical protein NFI96_021915 [Prochilodus magdalenae]|nr:hypothetical protein NFI96_021915 [Prochilodus magdalenae]
MERPLACWYTSTNTKKSSGLSNSVDLVISSVPRPFMFLSPSPIFGVGGNYSAQCNIPSDQLKNVTLSLYVRQLPLSPGNENFTYIGSRALLPEDVGAKIQQTNVNSSAEFICKMEVFYKGKVFMSMSSPMAAIPDELPAAVYSTARQSTSCAGYLLLRVKEVWSPICFNNNDPINEENLANVVCREVKCGHALTWNKDTAASQNFLGTPKCTGKENRVAECPIFNLTYCERELFYIICSDALPPPKLSTDHGTKPWVYIKSEETAKLRCALESSSMGKDDRIYLTITRGGQTLTSSRTRSDFSGNVWSIEYEVKEGEYACFASAGLNNAKTQNSNSIHIYIYNPPPAGAVAAAVITSVLGAAILIYICVCRTRKEVVLSEPVGGVCSSNIEIAEPVSVRPPQCS